MNDQVVTLVILAAVLALIPAWLAQRKGHSFVTWWLFGLLLWIAAMIAVFIVKDKRPRCPECREIVQRDAAKCPHCQSAIAGRVDVYVTPTPGPGPNYR